jgi:hypothetical protein
VTFNAYRQTGAAAVTGTKAMPTMSQPGDRYLTPDAMDFVALYRR